MNFLHQKITKLNQRIIFVHEIKNVLDGTALKGSMTLLKVVKVFNKASSITGTKIKMNHEKINKL